MKTSKKDFEYFKERCLHWAERFGLDEWNLYFFHETGKERCLASISADDKGCIAHIWLEPNWGKAVISRERLDETARHEMVHLLLANLVYLGSARYVTDTELEKCEEALVVKLTKLLGDE